jgi:hypothetical protein
MNIDNLTVKQLRELANSYNIILKSNMKKKEIIECLKIKFHPRAHTPILKIKRNSNRIIL